MALITRIADKAGALGSLVSAMGCAACFPALASFGAAIGLGFMSQYERLLVTILLPLFAALALVANALGWFAHRQWRRSLLGMIGPAIVLADTLFLRGHPWTASLLYIGLAFMIGVSVWDFILPANRRCGTDSCEPPFKNHWQHRAGREGKGEVK